MTQLSYLSKGIDVGIDRRLRMLRIAAIVCGLFPMLTGAGIFVLYFLFDWEILPVLGILMLPIGALLVLAGLIIATIWAIQANSIAKSRNEKTSWKSIGEVLALLLSNFIVAFGCVTMGSGLVNRPRVYVYVVNESGAPIDRCELRTRWRTSTFNSLSTGTTSTGDDFRRNWMGQLTIDLTQRGITRHLEPTLPATMPDDSLRVEVHVGPALTTDVKINSTSSSFMD